ncbi:MAG TPA: glycosyltransferase family A protein, partial [Puia sp.]|nr:glycosyltransferase family A protein [Puia sp.]
MSSFHPYTIKHLQLSNLGDYPSGEGNYYLVIWFEKIPLGHVWLNSNENSQVNLNRLVADAIIPTLQYYIERKDPVNQEWLLLAEAGRFNDLDSLLKSLHIGLYEIKNNESLSVIICTRNRPDSLKICLEKLFNSIDKDFELIVVDNAPSDGRTAVLVKAYPQIKYILEPRKGLDFARNTGVKAATGTIIAFTDDDVSVDEYWTRFMKQSFENRLTMAVTGLVLPSVLNTESQVHFEQYWSFNKGFLPLTFDHLFFNHHLDKGVPVWNIGAG